MPYEKICKGCGKVFKTPDETRVFCSWDCYNHYRHGKTNFTPLKRICKNCGKEFEVLYKERDKKFCSPECYNKHRTPKVLFCRECGKEFTAPGLKNQKFCSRSCMGKWHMKMPVIKQKMEKARWDGNHREIWSLIMRKRREKENPYLNEEWVRNIFEELIRSRFSLHAFAKIKHRGNNQLSRAFKHFMPAEYELLVESQLSRSKSYLKGRTFEYRVRDFLKDKDYFVLRSPRSKGPVDLVAIRKGEILFIQCKSWGCIDKEEKEQLISLAKSVGAMPLMVHRRPKPPNYPIRFVDLNLEKEISIGTDVPHDG